MDDIQGTAHRDMHSSALGSFERSTRRIDCDAEYKIGSSPFHGSCGNRATGTVAMLSHNVTPSAEWAAVKMQEAS